MKGEEIASEEQIKNLDLSYLNEQRSTQLRNLLLKYKDVFNDEPGHCKLLEHEIKLKEDFVPSVQRPYRVPERLKEEIDSQIQNLLDTGKIEKCVSEFGAPVVCVVKPDNSIRLCTDLRRLNKGILNDPYMLPRCEDIIRRVCNSNFISTVDASSGYFQISIKEADRGKQVFLVHSGHYQWNVTPFGIKTAQAMYARVMQELLREHHAYSDSYVDDTAIFSKTWRDHIIHLEKVLKAFQEAGMTLKLKKCCFGKNKVKFLGHCVGGGLHSPLLDKVETIKNIAEPTTKKALRSFIGLANYYKNYVNNQSC